MESKFDKESLKKIVDNLIKDIRSHIAKEHSLICIYGGDYNSRKYVGNKIFKALHIPIVLDNKPNFEEKYYNINFDSFIKQNNFDY